MIKLDQLQLKPCRFGAGEVPEQAFALASEIQSGRIQHGVWESGPGILDLKFDWSETVFIVEGYAEVENADTGETFAMSAGSLMSFEQGSHWRWRIPWKLKKIFTVVDLA
jgi:uncharacterized cupin superfamily protein